MTKDEFIKRAIAVHGNKYDYSKVEYINSSTKVCIICPEHGEFWQTPSDHYRGNGCPKCAGRGSKYTKDDFIKRAIAVHGDKYGYSKVEYINSETKVCIICPEHGEFWQTPRCHYRGNGCPKCAHEEHSKRMKGRGCMTKDDFITRVIAVHGNKYDYSKVEYINSETKVCIICPEHGEFWQTPSSHLSRQGCPKCAYEELSKRNRMTKDDFITRAIAVHGDKYDYSKVEYINASTKVCIICPEHGEFWQKPSSHYNLGHGCPKCAPNNHMTKDDFIKRSIAVHGDKYDYSKVVYSNNRTHIDIICPEHGEFWQRPSEHLSGHGCPKCAYEGRDSKYTKEICFKLSKQCSSRSEFQKLNGRAYDVSRINGWLDEMTHFETPKRYKAIEWITNNIVYVYEFPNKVVYIGRTNNLKRRHKEHKKIHKHSNGKISMSQVLKYSQDNLLPIPEPRVLKDNLTLSESRIWEDNMCKKYQQDGYHLLNIAKTGPNSGSIGGTLLYDDYDEILEKAKTCKSRSEFQRKFGSMYNAARRMDVYEKIAEECKWGKKRCTNGYWDNYDNCYEEFLRCDSSLEKLRKENNTCYQYSVKNGYTKSWRKKRVAPNKKWTYQTLSEIVKKYPHISELLKYENGAYHALRRMGLLYEFYPIPNGKPSGYWDFFENVEKEAKKYKSRWDLKKNNSSAYGAALRNNWLDELFPIGKPSKPSGYWTYQTLSEIVKKYPHISELRKYEGGAYDALRRMGLLYEFYPIQYDKPCGYWNVFENVEKEAKKYKSRGDFRKNSGSAYAAALRNNWLDKLFPKLYYDYDEILEKAKTCKSRSEFSKKFGSMYNAARRMNVFEKIAEECKWENNIHIKEIIVFNTDNVYIGEYKNAREASKATNVSCSLISMNCSGKVKQAKGFIFKYK